MNIKPAKDLLWENRVPIVKEVFPLETADDVNRVIRFYKWIPQQDKITINKKLNDAIKKFNMHIPIEKGSKLKYVLHPDHFEEVECYYVPERLYDVMFDVDSIAGHISNDCMFKESDRVGDVLRYFTEGYKTDGFRAIIQGINVWMMKMQDIDPRNYIDVHTSENCFFKIFNFITKMIHAWYEFQERFEPNDKIKLIMSFIEDARRSMFDDIINARAFKSGTLELLKQLVTSETRPIIIHLFRAVQTELISNKSNKDDTFDLVDKLESEIVAIADYDYKYGFSFTMSNVLEQASQMFPVIESIKTMELAKIEQRNHLNIITEYNSSSKDVVTESATPLLMDVINKLERKVYFENLQRYGKNFSLSIPAKFIMENVEFASNMQTVNTIDGHTFTLARINEGYAIVHEGATSNVLKLLEVYSDDMFDDALVENLTSHPTDFNAQITGQTFTLEFNRPPEADMDSLTEGITFDEEGGFVLALKPRSSFMDQYSANHQILVQNARAENFDGMKTNLAFLFSLINTIERDVIYSKKKVSEARRKDAEKARMFAINDFKTYLKVVLAKDPSFNFTTYYEQSNHGKIVFGFKKEEIVGIKRLFQTIILK